jgi:hypothetical protein
MINSGRILLGRYPRSTAAPNYLNVTAGFLRTWRSPVPAPRASRSTLNSLDLDSFRHKTTVYEIICRTLLEGERFCIVLRKTRQVLASLLGENRQRRDVAVAPITTFLTFSPPRASGLLPVLCRTDQPGSDARG